jgi:hypothetical protein
MRAALRNACRAAKDSSDPAIVDKDRSAIVVALVQVVPVASDALLKSRRFAIAGRVNVP